MTNDTTDTGLCPCCHLVKPIKDFPPSRRGGRRACDGYPQSWICRECSRAEVMARYRTKREYVNAYKVRRGCADCGRNDRAVVLTFDHLPGTVKVDKVSNMIATQPMSVILAEIAKCEVVCACCHAIRTEDRQTAEGWRSETPGALGTAERLRTAQQIFDF
jgi:hypothetical protein